MIHFHKWSNWSDPKLEGCFHVQRRNCKECNLSAFRVAETFHDYKVEKVIEKKLSSSNGNEYLERFTLFVCTRCSAERSNNDRHTVMDLT